jgi:hypothetical protein
MFSYIYCLLSNQTRKMLLMSSPIRRHRRSVDRTPATNHFTIRRKIRGHDGVSAGRSVAALWLAVNVDILLCFSRKLLLICLISMDFVFYLFTIKCFSKSIYLILI